MGGGWISEVTNGCRDEKGLMAGIVGVVVNWAGCWKMKEWYEKSFSKLRFSFCIMESLS